MSLIFFPGGTEMLFRPEALQTAIKSEPATTTLFCPSEDVQLTKAFNANPERSLNFVQLPPLSREMNSPNTPFVRSPAAA
jgi:hypothetical protein